LLLAEAIYIRLEVPRELGIISMLCGIIVAHMISTWPDKSSPLHNHAGWKCPEQTRSAAIMDDSDNEYSDIAEPCEETTSDVEGEPCFNSEPVRQNTLPFDALDSAACLVLAQKEVRELCELLCCSEDVAGILLRQFRWNREKLTEGAPFPDPCIS